MSKKIKKILSAIVAVSTMLLTQGCLDKITGGSESSSSNGIFGTEWNPEAGESTAGEVPTQAAISTLHDVLLTLPKAKTAFDLACKNSADAGAVNQFTQAFCNGQPMPTNLQELMDGLGVSNGLHAININTAGLTAFEVTAMNPRAILFPQNAENNPNSPFCIVAYARGDEGFVEAICRNQNVPIDSPNNFSMYLFDYDHPCALEKEGCSNAIKFGPQAETGWAQVSVYESSILQNTVLDCRQCHQAGGVNARISLRMPARANPWYGWCRDNRPSGIQVLNTINQVHGAGTGYATIPTADFADCDPADLEDVVIAVGDRDAAGNSTINSNDLQDEVDAQTGGTFLADDAASPTTEVFSTSMAQSNVDAVNRLATEDLSDGVSELFPYKTSVIAPIDKAKFTAASAQYQQLLSGAITEIDSPHDIITTNQNVLRQSGKMLYPTGLDGDALLRRACAQCHNSALKQDISRAAFNVDLDAMGAKKNEAIDKAILRIDLGVKHIRVMPPTFFAALSDDERDRLKAYLLTQKSP